MKRKICLVLLSGVILLGVCGCGNESIENKIKGKTFTYKEESNQSAYGKAITVEEFSFIGNGKGYEKVNIEFTGSLKEYADKNNLSEPTTYDITYIIDEDIINITTELDEHKLKYDKDSECLIDIEKETRRFCQ